MTLDLDLITTSPAAFRDVLMIQSAHGPARFGAIMADFQRRDFEALDPALIAVANGQKPAIGRYWLERVKGASKDSDLACALLWLMLAAHRPLRCQVGAFDQGQASELKLIIQQIIGLDGPLNTLLREVIQITRDEIRCTANGSVTELLATSAMGSHGSRPDVVLIDEATHITNEDFAATLADNLDKVPRGLMLVATNAGSLDSWQYRWHTIAKESDRWYFSAVTEPPPWVSAADLAESKLRNSAARFDRLWRGRWVSGGDALDRDDIQRAITLAGPPREPDKECQHVVGVDLSTRRDFCGVVVLAAHGATRRVRLAYARSWKPGPNGVDLIAVQEEIARVARHFRARVYADPWQATLMLQQLRKCNIECVETPFTSASMSHFAMRLLEIFREGRCDLYRDGDGGGAARLIDDLGRLSIVEKPPMGYKLVASHDPQKGHADLGYAYVLALCPAMDLCATNTCRVGAVWRGLNGLRGAPSASSHQSIVNFY